MPAHQIESRDVKSKLHHYQLFNSLDYIAFIVFPGDNRIVRGDQISWIDRICSFAAAILNLPSDNANSSAVIINDLYCNSFNQSEIEVFPEIPHEVVQDAVWDHAALKGPNSS
jgi:hypothetical protein